MRFRKLLYSIITYPIPPYKTKNRRTLILLVFNFILQIDCSTKSNKHPLSLDCDNKGCFTEV